MSTAAAPCMFDGDAVSRLVALGVWACLVCACARSELSIGDDAAVGVDGGPEPACRWSFGELHRIAPEGGFSHGAEHDRRGTAWDGSNAWVITLESREPWFSGSIRLHRLDSRGAPTAPFVVIAEQPIYWEVYADISLGEGSGLVVYNGCPDSGCDGVCIGGWVDRLCEMTPRYVARTRAFERNGSLGPSRMLFSTGSLNAEPLVAAPTGGSHVVLTKWGRVAVSGEGEPSDFARLELPSYPRQGFGMPGTSNAVFGLAPVDPSIHLHVLDGDGTTRQELRVPAAPGGARHLSLSDDGQRLAVMGRLNVDVVSLAEEFLHRIMLPGTILDVEYIGDRLYVIAADGPGNIEDRGIEIIAFDAHGTELGRRELPHRGFGLLGTGSGALVFTVDPEDYAPMAHSARCEP